jgi:hypothetical protein
LQAVSAGGRPATARDIRIETIERSRSEICWRTI